MELVNSIDEILANLLLLHDYLRRPSPQARDWAIQTIRRGRHFVAYQSDGHWLIGPSRFVGYHGNSRARHEANREQQEIHGTRTDERIRQLLGHNEVANDELESQYQGFCETNHVQPEDRQRLFWVIQNPE